MAEIEFKVEQYGVGMDCDSCGEGSMVQTGQALMSSPPKFPHKCGKCGIVVNYTTQYPEIRFREVKS